MALGFLPADRVRVRTQAGSVFVLFDRGEAS
jgi:hypothetical protein